MGLMGFRTSKISIVLCFEIVAKMFGFAGLNFRS